MPKPPDPIPVAEFDKAVARQHREADLDRNGFLTLQEVRSGVDRLADRAIQDRFAAIDRNRDQAIDYAEFAEWQKAMGSQALSDISAASINRSIVPSNLPFDAGDDIKGRVFGRLIQPLNPALVAQADANFDGQVDVAELQAHQRRRFALLDANSDGFLAVNELSDARGNRAGGMAEDTPSNPVPSPQTPLPTTDGSRARVAALAVKDKE